MGEKCPFFLPNACRIARTIGGWSRRLGARSAHPGVRSGEDGTVRDKLMSGRIALLVTGLVLGVAIGAVGLASHATTAERPLPEGQFRVTTQDILMDDSTVVT